MPCTEPKEWHLPVGVLWDFPGTSGRISQYERETTERAFMQVNDLRRPDIAGHGVGWSLPGHLTIRNQQLRAERRTPSAPIDIRPLTGPDLPNRSPDIPSERASNERHERHFSVEISPVTPTPNIMRTRKTAGQEPFAAGSRIATHSTWWVIGNTWTTPRSACRAHCRPPQGSGPAGTPTPP